MVLHGQVSVSSSADSINFPEVGNCWELPLIAILLWFIFPTIFVYLVTCFMDFFKSIISQDPDPPESKNYQGSESNLPTDPSPQPQDGEDLDVLDRSSQSQNVSDVKPNSTEGDAGWSFGCLMKTLTARSESVMETYRRDLREFGSGLKKETEIFREAARRAVKDLPASIEVAHGAIDGVLKSTADIISQGKDTLLSPSKVEPGTLDANRSLNPRRYSWFDAQLRAIQSDLNTYTEEPEDLEDYNKWKLGFELAEKSEEVENLIGENGAMEGIFKSAVPSEVDKDTFLYRYFYRVHRLKQQENVRASLVKRAAMSFEEEEELTWDVDEDEEEDADDKKANKHQPNVVHAEENKEMGNDKSSQILNNRETSTSNEEGFSATVVDAKGKNKSNVVGDPSGKNEEEVQRNAELAAEAAAVEMKADLFVPTKDSDTKDVSNKVEEIGWNEIEDVGTEDEYKVAISKSPKGADARMRLSAAQAEEDLSWDIEDEDDEHAKI